MENEDKRSEQNLEKIKKVVRQMPEQLESVYARLAMVPLVCEFGIELLKKNNMVEESIRLKIHAEDLKRRCQECIDDLNRHIFNPQKEEEVKAHDKPSDEKAH